MQSIARQPVTCAEAINHGAQCPLFALKAFGLAFLARELGQKPLYDCRYRGIQLSRPYSGSPVRVIVE